MVSNNMVLLIKKQQMFKRQSEDRIQWANMLIVSQKPAGISRKV